MSTLDKNILKIAIPAIIANITVPLLGLVDVAIAGHLGHQHYIGAIAIGSMLFNVIYWVLGFLRMGTSGLTAQAYGQADSEATSATLWRSLLIGQLFALLIIVLRHPIFSIAMWLISPPQGIEGYVSTYFHICIWGAPATIALYSLTGWLVGLQDTRVPMLVAIVQNVVNIAVSLVLVEHFRWNIDGVATGTLTAQWTGLILAIALTRFRHKQMSRRVSIAKIVYASALRQFAHVNTFIFLRTLCLVGVNLFFVAYGSRQGDIILAVNTLLMQLFTLFSYIMDGFAYSAESLCGYAQGEVESHRNTSSRLSDIIKRHYAWGILMSLVFTFLYATTGSNLLNILTDQTEVVAAALPYRVYTILIPAVGMAAFVSDGILIGLTAARTMLNASAIASIMFAMILYLLAPYIANHALWIAYLAFLAARGGVEMYVIRHKYGRAL